MVEFDAFADIYDIWTGMVPNLEQNRIFYVQEYLREAGPVVELGVGNGRIAIEAARQGKSLTGVDYSAEMLAACRREAEAAGVLDRLTLVQADFRDFALPEPVALITVPFQGIAHLLTPGERRAGLSHIYSQLAPGGRLIFDHFIFDPEMASRSGTAPHLRAEYTDAATGADVLLWTTTIYDMENEVLRLIAWTDELDEQGIVTRRRYRRLNVSWFDPEDMGLMLEDVGFEVEVLYGDFERGPFDLESAEQVWVAQRPTPRARPPGSPPYQP